MTDKRTDLPPEEAGFPDLAEPVTEAISSETAAEPIPSETIPAETTSAEPTSAEPISAETTSAEPISAEPTPEEPTPAEPDPAEPTAEQIPTEPAAKLTIDCLPAVNYALQQNRIPFVRSLSVENLTEEPLENVRLSLSASPAFAEEFTAVIARLPEGKRYEIPLPEMKPDAEFLAELTEKVTGALTLTMRASLPDGTETFVREKREITAMAFDEWPGAGLYPELLAAFVTPNHPAAAKILAGAAEHLRRWTGDPSFDAYLTQNPDRVRKQAAAIFEAIRDEEIVYCVAPASFETAGQRVRLCDAALEEKMGCCLDLSLLYASCLEAAGLHPLLILLPGHCMTGVWLSELSFPESVQDDTSALTKRLAQGVNELAAVEITLAVSGKSASFDEAAAAAEAKLGPDSDAFTIDVRRARLSGISPLPVRVRQESGWRIEEPRQMRTPDSPAAPTAPRDVTLSDEEFAQTAEENAPKLVQWERKLLDLGLRNNLINLRWSRTLAPLLTPSPDELEDALADGGDFTLFPRPLDWQELSGGTETGFEAVCGDTGAGAELIRSEFQNKRLRSVLSDAELSQTVKNLYRASRTSLEENGANTLYLALGLLRWYENPKSEKPRYAPVVLLPVEMIRRSAAQGYAIRLREEEPQMNVTILEKIKQDFGISVGGLDPLPGDEHGVDVRRVFTILRRAVMSQKRWDVLEGAYLGIFSFSQFVMWNDLRSRAGDLLKNDVVRSLTEGKLCWDAKAMEIGDKVSEDGVLLPMAADASQLFAIRAACAGESFVLHGPPGTGKSQTITSLIANALAQGKSVLFAAEKMAALSVVQKRLESIGLGPFCLELHSNKSKKRDVLEQLRRASEVTGSRTPAQYAEKAEQIAGLRAELDAYADQLHRVGDCGLSLRRLIGEYEDCPNADLLPGFTEEQVSGKTRGELEAMTLLLERMTAAGDACGYSAEHPLAPVGAVPFSRGLIRELPELTSACRTALGRMEKPAGELAETLGTGEIASFEDAKKLYALAQELHFWSSVPSAWAKCEDPAPVLTGVRETAARYGSANEMRRKLSAYWNDAFFTLNGEGLLAEYSAASGKWALARALEIRRIVKKMSVYSRGEVEKDRLEESFLGLWNWQMEKSAADALYRKWGGGLDDLIGLSPEAADWQKIAELAAEAEKHILSLRALAGDGLRIRFGADPSVRGSIGGVREAFPAFEEAWSSLAERLAWNEEDVLPSEDGSWFDAQAGAMERAENAAGSLKDYLAYRNLAGEAEAAGLSPAVRCYRNGASREEVLSGWRRSALTGLILLAIDGGDALNAFSGPVFNEKIEQYKRADRELTELAKAEAFCRLAAKVPDFTGEAAQSSEVGVLQRMIRSGGRGTSIRRLFEQVPNLLPRLCPCMLMSPLSAAQYLDPAREPFDIVIFDEASQLQTCKAAGVLARGKSAVIVGDPKQMPPTSFFTVSAADEDNPEIEDLESILDDCLALNMPQTHLLWHYRSRHESLIAFSNRRFYDNRLFTFPSVNDRESKVTLEKVEGVFDRGNTRRNPAEAEAVVDELIRRCHDPKRKGQSVGVVTFNISQQELIEDLLNASCRTDPELEAWAFSSEEPLFIKNLENVQGDERDVILFSVGYGPDKAGKVSMNFGPLNRDGGWRRLNVAVSRARCEMKVFTSMEPEQIRLDSTAAEGVASLKAFLEYAAGKELSVSADDPLCGEARDGLAQSVAAVLRENGWDADVSVGRSGYRVDVAVADPENPERYLAAILLDGAVYGEAKTTRDREIAQIGVLEGLGWKTIRLWAVDWWDDRRKETDRLLALLNDLNENREEPPEPDEVEEAASADPADTPDPADPSDIPPQDSADPQPQKLEAAAVPETAEPVRSHRIADPVMPYRAAILQPCDLGDAFYSMTYRSLLRKAAEEVIRTESPVSRSVLIRKIAQNFGAGRVTQKVTETVDRLILDACARVTEEDGERFVWKWEEHPAPCRIIRTAGEGENRREAKEIPTAEAANCAVWVLRQQIGLPEGDLIRETAKRMGYARMGNAVTAKFASAVSFAKAEGWMEEGAGGSLILTEAGSTVSDEILEAAQELPD